MGSAADPRTSHGCRAAAGSREQPFTLPDVPPDRVVTLRWLRRGSQTCLEAAKRVMVLWGVLGVPRAPLTQTALRRREGVQTAPGCIPGRQESIAAPAAPPMAHGRGWQGPHPRRSWWSPWGGVARAPTKTSHFAAPSRLSLLTLTDRNKLQHLPYALLLLLPALTCYYLFSKPGSLCVGWLLGQAPAVGRRAMMGCWRFWHR